MNKFLLIGGAGFIGSAISKKLVTEGNNVSIFELPGSNCSRLESIRNSISIHYGNLNQTELIKEIIEKNAITTVLHLASSLIPSSNEEQYIADFKDVVLPTIKLLSIFSDLNVKLIFFSSGGAVYGQKSNGFFSEKDALLPLSYYGQSKLILEESIIFESRKSNLNYLILRPSNPYGIGQNLYGKQGLIATCIHNILTDQKIEVWGDGSVVRDYIYIDDFVALVINAIDKGKDKQIYNIGSGTGCSVNQVIDILRNFTTKNFEVAYLESRNVDAPSLILDINKLQNLINFNYTSITKGIHSFYEYESNLYHTKIP
nr:NAD-dependent epimerase/dehydratase family protein [uncultured Flavobacterium sp.]